MALGNREIVWEKWLGKKAPDPKEVLEKLAKGRGEVIDIVTDTQVDVVPLFSDSGSNELKDLATRVYANNTRSI